MSPMRSNIGAWIVFVVLGGAMWYLRYQPFLKPDQLEMMKTYGPFAVIGLHVVITLTAFQDSVFQGILCMLVPFYSLYYVFLVTDAFYLRAVGAALLIGVGVDSALFFQGLANEWIARASDWIASGGGKMDAVSK